MDMREMFVKAGVNIANQMIAHAREELNDQMREYVKQFPTWPVTNGFNEANVVEGSITEPITDEGRLLK